MGLNEPKNKPTFIRLQRIDNCYEIYEIQILTHYPLNPFVIPSVVEGLLQPHKNIRIVLVLLNVFTECDHKKID